jgi:hypothetical protein
MTGEMDSLATYVEIYGAGLATAGLLGGIYKWRRDHRTYVDVAPSIALSLTDGLELVTVNVRNRSQHTIRVVEVGFRKQNETRRHWGQVPILQPDQGMVEMGIPSNEDDFLAVRESRLASALDFFKPVVAYVRLSTDEVFESKPTTLRSHVPASLQGLVDELDAAASSRSQP